MNVSVKDESTQTAYGLHLPSICRIVDCKTVNGQRFYKVKWDASWESEEALTPYKHLMDAYWSFLNRVAVEQKKFWLGPGHKRAYGTRDCRKLDPAQPENGMDDAALMEQGVGRSQLNIGSNFDLQLTSPSDMVGMMAAAQYGLSPQSAFGNAQFAQLQAMLNSPPVLYLIAQALGMAPNICNPSVNASNLGHTLLSSAHNSFLNVYGSYSLPNQQQSSHRYVHPAASLSHPAIGVTPLGPQLNMQSQHILQPIPMPVAGGMDDEIRSPEDHHSLQECQSSYTKSDHQPSPLSTFRTEAGSPLSRESTSRDSDKMETSLGHLSSPTGQDFRAKPGKVLKPGKDDEKESVGNPGLHRVKNFDNPYAKVVFVCKVCKEELDPSPIRRWKEHFLIHQSADEKPPVEMEDFFDEIERSEWDSIWCLPMDGSAALGVEGIRYMESFKSLFVDVLLVCKICKKEQEPKYSRNWKMHYLSHLPNEERPHRCSLCGDGYVRPDRLRRHIQQQHPEEAAKSIGEQHTPLSFVDEASLPEYETYMSMQQRFGVVPNDELVPDEKDDSKTWVKL